MNKKEKKLLDDLKIKSALRWTDGAEKDIPVPTDLDLVTGYFFNSYRYEVTKGCSHSVSHSISHCNKTTSQKGVPMYSSKFLALKAMRHEVELRLALELKKIDDLIDNELSI